MGTILHSCADFIIADKPHGIPTVPLKNRDMEGTLLALVAAECPDILSVEGRNPWEYGTLHRLDTATSGLVVFARTQEAYAYLSDIQEKDLMEKTYRAVVTRGDRLRGFDRPDSKTFTITSYFRSYGPKSREVRPTQDIRRADTPLLYTTRVADCGDNIMHCTITRGFRHQIRAHLAWAGLPIVGDPIYGTDPGTAETPSGTPAGTPVSTPAVTPACTLELDCFRVSFPLPDNTPFRFSKR